MAEGFFGPEFFRKYREYMTQQGFGDQLPPEQPLQPEQPAPAPPPLPDRNPEQKAYEDWRRRALPSDGEPPAMSPDDQFPPEWRPDHRPNAQPPIPPNIPPNIPPPPPSRGSPFAGQRIEANAGGLLGGLGGALTGAGGGGLLGGADTDTLDTAAPQGDGTLGGFGLLPPDDTTGAQGTDQLPGSAGADTGAGAPPRDTGQNPSFLHRLFGGGGGLGSDEASSSRRGQALMQLGAGIASAGGVGWGEGIGKGLSLAATSSQRSREQESEDKARREQMAERIREHQDQMQLEREKLKSGDVTDAEKSLNAIGLHRGDPGFNDKMTALLFKDKSPAAVQEFEYGQSHPEFVQQQLAEKRAAAANVNVNAEGGKYGKPPEGRAYVYGPKDPADPNSEQVVQMEDVTLNGKTVQRPMTVPTEGSVGDVAQKAHTGMTQVLTQMGKEYQELDKMGAIPNPDRTPAENVGSSLESSGPGQALGQATGDRAAGIRKSILNKQPMLINRIRQATGMNGKAMDSNTELQFYMQMTSDPHQDIWSNYAALDLLDQQYGDGTWLDSQEFDDDTKARIRNAGFKIEKAAPKGFKLPDDFEDGQAVWDELSKEEKIAWFNKHPN